MKLLSTALLLAFAAPLATGASAAEAPAAKIGSTMRDAGDLRLGRVDRVFEDGSVRIIFDGRFVTVPADKISVAENGDVTTSLTKREVAKLR